MSLLGKINDLNNFISNPNIDQNAKSQVINELNSVRKYENFPLLINEMINAQPHDLHILLSISLEILCKTNYHTQITDFTIRQQIIETLISIVSLHISDGKLINKLSDMLVWLMLQEQPDGVWNDQIFENIMRLVNEHRLNQPGWDYFLSYFIAQINDLVINREYSHDDFILNKRTQIKDQLRKNTVTHFVNYFAVILTSENCAFNCQRMTLLNISNQVDWIDVSLIVNDEQLAKIGRFVNFSQYNHFAPQIIEIFIGMINKGMDNPKKLELFKYINLPNIVNQINYQNDLVFLEQKKDNYDSIVTEYNYALKYFIDVVHQECYQIRDFYESFSDEGTEKTGPIVDQLDSIIFQLNPSVIQIFNTDQCETIHDSLKDQCKFIVKYQEKDNGQNASQLFTILIQKSVLNNEIYSKNITITEQDDIHMFRLKYYIEYLKCLTRVPELNSNLLNQLYNLINCDEYKYNHSMVDFVIQIVNGFFERINEKEQNEEYTKLTLQTVEQGISDSIHEIVKFNYYEQVKKIATLIQSEDLKLNITNQLLILLSNHLKGPYINYLSRLANLFSVITNRFRDVLADRQYDIFNNVQEIFKLTKDNITVLKEIMQIFESIARLCVVCVRKQNDEEERNNQFKNIFTSTIKSKVLDILYIKVQDKDQFLIYLRLMINLLNPISIDNKLNYLMDQYYIFLTHIIESNTLSQVNLTTINEIITINIKCLNIDIHKFKQLMIPYLKFYIMLVSNQHIIEKIELMSKICNIYQVIYNFSLTLEDFNQKYNEISIMDQQLTLSNSIILLLGEYRDSTNNKDLVQDLKNLVCNFNKTQTSMIKVRELSQIFLNSQIGNNQISQINCQIQTPAHNHAFILLMVEFQEKLLPRLDENNSPFDLRSENLAYLLNIFCDHSALQIKNNYRHFKQKFNVENIKKVSMIQMRMYKQQGPDVLNIIQTKLVKQIGELQTNEYCAIVFDGVLKSYNKKNDSFQEMFKRWHLEQDQNKNNK